MTAPQREFTLVRDFDAPRDLVYRVWTEPEHMSQTRYPTVAEFREIVEPERLVFTGATRTTDPR